LDSTEISVNKLNPEDAIKRILELSKPQTGKLIFYPDGRVYRNDDLIAENPDEEQQEWVKKRMTAPSKTWQRWFVGQYFTEEQKKQLGLTDKDISWGGMR